MITAAQLQQLKADLEKRQNPYAAEHGIATGRALQPDGTMGTAGAVDKGTMGQSQAAISPQNAAMLTQLLSGVTDFTASGVAPRKVMSTDDLDMEAAPLAGYVGADAFGGMPKRKPITRQPGE